MGNKEISDMLDALEGTVSTGGGTDAPTTEDVKTDPPATDPPDDFETEPPAETDAPTTDEPEDELTKVKRENEELKKKMDELSAAPKTKAPKTEPPTTDAPIEEKDFLKDVDLEELTNDPQSFNKLLNNIYRDAVQTARGELKSLSQSTLEKVPELVDTSLTTQEKLKALTENFYKENDDLVGFKKTVGVVFGELAGDNPDKQYDEVLKMTGDEVRKRLGLEKPTGKRKPKQDDDDPPPLPRKKGGRVRPKPKKTSGLSKEIGDMNEALGN